MKILRVIASADLASGGPIEGALRVGEILAAFGHRQDLLTIDPPDAPWLGGLPCVVYAAGRPRDARSGHIARLLTRLRYAPDALAWLQAHVADYDAVIVSGLWNYSTHIARRVMPGSGVPYVVFTHGMLDPWFKRASPLKTFAKQLLWWINEGVLLRHADAVVFTTEDERVAAWNSFRPYQLRERVVSYGTADAPPSAPSQGLAFANAVPKLGSRPFLLFLSRIHQKKGCDLLVAAFGRLASEHPELDLVIAGPDQVGLKSVLQAQAISAGVDARVHWPGMLRDDAKWGALYGCTAFVLPSHQENFGIVVAEAMACRKAVLISDKVNIWRDVADADAGLIDEDTQPGTERMLRRFLAMKKEEQAAMGERGRVAFIEKFEIRRAAADLVAVLEDSIARRKSTRAPHGEPYAID